MTALDLEARHSLDGCALSGLHSQPLIAGGHRRLSPPLGDWPFSHGTRALARVGFMTAYAPKTPLVIDRRYSEEARPLYAWSSVGQM